MLTDEERYYELDKEETTRRLASGKRTVTLIYSTKPELKPLAFVKDPSDVLVVINQRVLDAKMRAAAAAEKEGRAKTEVTLALRRWESARWIEVELDPEAPVPTTGE